WQECPAELNPQMAGMTRMALMGRVSVSIMGNANEAQPRTVERCSACIRLTILAGMLRFLRLNSRKEHHHASDPPKGRLSAASGLDRFKSEVDARSPVASKLEGE